MFLQTISSLKEVNMQSSRQGITMKTCKTKAIWAYLGIFINVPARSGKYSHNQTLRALCIESRGGDHNPSSLSPHPAPCRPSFPHPPQRQSREALTEKLRKNLF